jgi:Rrf2 family protein
VIDLRSQRKVGFRRETNSYPENAMSLMELTAKTRYGVRAMFDIAYHARGFPAQIKDISQRQRVGVAYLGQIFMDLKKAGILGSKRGPKGGYFLLKEAQDITIYDILECTEGPIELVFCVGKDPDGESSGAPLCDIKTSAWQARCGGRSVSRWLTSSAKRLFRTCAKRPRRWG